MASQRDLVWDKLAEGLTDKEIAFQLGLHYGTVRRTMLCLMREQDVSNRVALAIRHPKFAGAQKCGR
jgi:DNA-binding NarL/FixJ family response regulator